MIASPLGGPSSKSRGTFFFSIAVIPASREQSSREFLHFAAPTANYWLLTEIPTPVSREHAGHRSGTLSYSIHCARLAVCLLRRARVNSNAAVDQLGRMGCNAHWSTRHAPAECADGSTSRIDHQNTARPSTPVQMARPAARAFGLSGGCRLGKVVWESSVVKRTPGYGHCSERQPAARYRSAESFASTQPMMPRSGQAAVWLSDRLHDACPLLLLQRHFLRGIGGANTSGDSATGAILGESGLT